MAVSSPQYVPRSSTKGVNGTSNGPFVSGSPYFVADNNYPESNVSKATSLVKQVAQETGQPVAITLNHVPDANTTRIAEYLQQQLQTVGMKVTLAPVQQADIINTALLGTFEAQVWRQFGAVDPDLNYIFWSPTNANTPVFSINMARNTDPNMRDGSAQGAPVPGPVRPDRRLPGGQQAPGPGHPLRLDRPDHLGRRPPTPRCRTSTTRPPPPGARPFGMIGGSIWPTQIWLNS